MEAATRTATARKNNMSDQKTHTENIVIPKTHTEAVSQIYTVHRDSIKKHSGRVLHRYTIRLSTNIKDYAEQLWNVYHLQKTAFKVDFSIGFILRNTITMTTRYWHTSQNEAKVLETPEVIRNRADFAAVIERLNTVDINPETTDGLGYDQWVVDLVTNVSVYVNKIHGQPLC